MTDIWKFKALLLITTLVKFPSGGVKAFTVRPHESAFTQARNKRPLKDGLKSSQ